MYKVLLKIYLMLSGLISLFFYAFVFGMLPTSLVYSDYFSVFWLLFYILNTPFLVYYLFVKGNIFEKKIQQYVDILDAAISRGNKFISNMIRKLCYILESVVSVLFIQQFYLGHFRVPTPSMVPVVMPGDHYLVDMVSVKFSSITRDEIYIFQSPVEKKSTYSGILGRFGKERWCKRLVGMPGDVLRIEDEVLYINGEPCKRRYTQGRMSFDWVVPKKGDKLKLESAILASDKGLVEDVSTLKTLENLEIIYPGNFTVNGKKTGPVLDKKVYLRLLQEKEIVLDEDLYFFLGDNTEGSHDSRYVGFVPKSNIDGALLFRIWPLKRFGIIE